MSKPIAAACTLPAEENKTTLSVIAARCHLSRKGEVLSICHTEERLSGRGRTGADGG